MMVDALARCDRRCGTWHGERSEKGQCGGHGQGIAGRVGSELTWWSGRFLRYSTR